jgi:hypothetical protein
LIFAFVNLRESNGKYHGLFDNSEIDEIRTLLSLAMEAPEARAQDAAAVIVAMRDTMSAEIAGDRPRAIVACRQILNLVAKEEFPETWAAAPLKARYIARCILGWLG